jgi:hypothetical protein
MSLRGFVLPAALVLAADAWLLVGVARNRAGEPEAELELTERELHLVRLGDENTGVALGFEWEGPRFRPPWEAAPTWFDEAKLRELGYDPGKRAHRLLPKQAFVVFERTGGAALKAVDASRDANALRRRYPDRGRFLILRGMVRMAVPEEAPRQPRGAVVQLDISNVYVPLPYSRALAGLSPTPRRSDASRYTVTLRLGRHHEPWVTSCRRSP